MSAFQIQLVFLKKANGWHPFLYNIKIDGCQFLRKQYNVVTGIAYSYLKPFTNLNHTCPYMVGKLFN